MMTKKYESAYAGYVYEPSKAHWSSDEEVKSKLVEIDYTKKKIDVLGGLPLISDGKHAFIDAGDSHTAIAAISGMKKSICGFMPLIYTLGKCGENMVVTDPKGELFERTSGFLVKQGYNVRCLDFRTLDKDGYNILEYPARVYRSGDKDRGLMMANDLVNVFAEKQRSSGKCDVFWPDTAAMFLSGTAAIMFDSYPDIEAINISNWAEFNTDKGVRTLNEFVSEVEAENTAMLNLRTILAEPEKTLMSTLSTASSFLGPFIQNNKLARMLSHSTINVDELCNKKTALYIITDDTTTTCDTIVGIIISQIQTNLVERAYKKKNGKLDNRVNFVLDEFTSYPIPNMENALATHRSRNIRYYLCIQSIAGLKRRYEHYEALLANCGNLLFLGTTEKKLLDRVSEQCGTTKITPDGSEKPLVSVTELMSLEKTWDYKECIYLNLSESIRYSTRLPSIEAYDLGSYSPPAYNVEHPKVKAYSISKLVHDISYGKAHIPFSEQEEKIEKVNNSQKRYSNKKESNDKPESKCTEESDEDYSDLQKELERKFDELFGALDSDDE